MRNISCPEIDNVDLWDKIVSHKHQPGKNNLLRVRNEVFARYKFFESNVKNLDAIKPAPEKTWEEVSKDLVSCYGENVEFKKIRKRIFNDFYDACRPTRCPYCLLNRPDTLEHYFDKADYPEFSVYVPNLVPCCSECNTKKNTDLFTQENQRNYIHFYYDKLPSEQFLFVRFTVEEGCEVPNVNISLKFQCDKYSSGLILRHFEKLSLLSKYKYEILDRIPPIVEEIQENHRAGRSKEEIISVLKIRLHSLVNNYGNNYWETCVFEGILNSPNFLDWVIASE